MVNFRTYKRSYKEKQSVPNPKEDWLIFENTNESIVDKETWELAQRTGKTVRRIDTLGEANPLTGLMFCADCGAKMYNLRSRKMPDSDELDPRGDGYRRKYQRRKELAVLRQEEADTTVKDAPNQGAHDEKDDENHRPLPDEKTA